MLPTSSSSNVVNDNNGVLIGAIIGSILGFLAFLALLLCLIYCCCCYKKRRSHNQNVKITNNQNLATRSTLSMYPSEAQELARQSYQNMTHIHTQHTSMPIAYLPTTSSTHTVDKVTQFNNHIDVSHNLNASHALSNVSCSSNHNSANIRSMAPEVYLKMITVSKDVNEDIASMHTDAFNRYEAAQISASVQRNEFSRDGVWVNSGEHYAPNDEGFYTERKEYVIHNIQQQTPQQNEISVHYV